MSALAVLGAPLWAWLALELVLSAALWAVYQLLARHLATAAERFLFLKLLFVALVLLPFVPAVPLSFSHPLSAPWEVLLPATLPTAALTMTGAARTGTGFVATAAVLGGGLYLGWLGCCLTRFVVGAQRLRKLTRSAEALAIAGPAPVLLHDRELAPATVGIVRPRILISRQLYQTLSPRQVQLILQHEAVHVRRHDPLFNALVVLLRDVLAFSPFVRVLARHFESEMELSVDAEVLAQADIVPREYGRLLLDLATQLPPDTTPVGSRVFVARSLIARRISAMSRPASATSRKTLLIATFVACTSLCGAGIATLHLGPTAWAGNAVTAPSKTTAPQAAEAPLQIFLVAPEGSRSVLQEDGLPLTLEPTPIMTSADLDSATLQAPSDLPLTVGIHMKPAAAARFAAFTGSHLGQKLAIVLEGKLLAAPVIKARIDGSSLVLSGQLPDAMRRLAAAINAGQPLTAPTR